jgi:hypothetical protein
VARDGVESLYNRETLLQDIGIQQLRVAQMRIARIAANFAGLLLFALFCTPIYACSSPIDFGGLQILLKVRDTLVQDNMDDVYASYFQNFPEAGIDWDGAVKGLFCPFNPSTELDPERRKKERKILLINAVQPLMTASKEGGISDLPV